MSMGGLVGGGDVEQLQRRTLPSKHYSQRPVDPEMNSQQRSTPLQVMACQTMARPTAATLLRAGDLDGLASLVTACGCSQQPRSFFNFSSASSGAEAPELATPCLGLSSYSLWAWVKLDAQPAKEAVEPRLIFALHGGGQSVELVVNDLRLSMLSSQKGTLSALQCEKPLTAGTWHLIMCDHAAPPRLDRRLYTGYMRCKPSFVDPL